MRVYLATGPTIPNHFTPPCEHRFLVSYASAKMTVAKLYQPVLEAGATDYCVDSGAHIWLSAFFKKAEKPPIGAVEKHIENFITAIRALPTPPTFMVELDLQAMYGLDVVRAWRRDIWVPLEHELGVRICYVWHTDDGGEEWERMLLDPNLRYLGLATRDIMPTLDRARMVLRAYYAGKPVHGFASTGAKIMRHVPYYSVDSTSWLAGQIFGSSRVFDTATGSMRVPKIGRNGAKEDVHGALLGIISTQQAVSLQGAASTDRVVSREVARQYALCAARSFRQFEDWYTAYWKARGVDWDARLSTP